MITPLLNFNSIIKKDNKSNKITTLHDSIRKHACKIVKKVITDDTCSSLKSYFEVNNHSKETRNGNFLLKVPRIKLETARSSFYYMGVKFYNDLPLILRKVKSYEEF